MNAAQYLGEFLRDRGVRWVFGLPGTESIELVEGVRQAGIDFVLVQHEATAAFCASMVGKLTGVPGVCLVTAGPGAMNVANGIAQAHLDRMPLLVLIGDHLNGLGQPAHQRLPPDLFAPIARSSLRIDAAQIGVQLTHAFEACTSGMPGPSVVTFPTPEALREAGTDPVPPRAESHLEPDLSAIGDAIRASTRAVVLAGLGISNAGAEASLLRFVEAIGCPVVDTPQIKGAIPSDHPQYVGTFATHRDEPVTELISASDLVIAVGLDSAEFLRPWSVTVPTVRLVEPGNADDAGISAQATVEGRLSPMLDQLARDAAPSASWPRDEVTATRRRFIGESRLPDAEPGRMLPQEVVAALASALPEETIVTVDVGSHKLLMVRTWISRRPNSFLNSSGLSSMGTGIPFALAARMVHPDRPVVAVIGDAGYLMYLGEMATLARTEGPLVVVVMADAALSSIRIKQLRRSYPPVGTELQHDGLSLAAAAEACGLAAARVEDTAALQRAVEIALRADRPTVIEAMVDARGYELTQ